MGSNCCPSGHIVQVRPVVFVLGSFRQWCCCDLDGMADDDDDDDDDVAGQMMMLLSR